MDRWLARLERRFGRHASPGLTWILIGMQALAYVLSRMKPEIAELLVLDRSLVLHGQAWRLVTFLFVPPPGGMITVFFELYMAYIFGTALEAQWGAFKYQMFWLVGTVATAATAMALDVPATGLALMMSMFLAFATLFPDYQILLLFVFPVKVKWLGILDACALAWTAFNAPGLEKLIPVAAVGNYLLFFGPTLVGLFRQGATVASRTRARERFDAAAPVRERRVCALCGVTDEDPSVEFRVCTCAKCGKPTEYCLAHARNH